MIHAGTLGYTQKTLGIYSFIMLIIKRMKRRYFYGWKGW